MQKPIDAMSAEAENFLWNYCRQQLEREGRGEAALYLKYYLKARLGNIESGEGLTTYKFDMFYRESDFSAKLNAADKILMGWYFALLAENSEKDISSDEALRVAQEAAAPPNNAVLAMAEYEEVAGRNVFLARWKHENNGIPVERDFIHVLVNGKNGKAFALYRKWHEVNFNFSER